MTPEEKWEEIKRSWSQSGLFDLAPGCENELDKDVLAMIELARNQVTDARISR